MLYMIVIGAVVIYLMFWAAPAHGTTNVFVYIGICSLVGSLTVMSVKVSIASPYQPVPCAEHPSDASHLQSPLSDLRSVDIKWCAADPRLDALVVSQLECVWYSFAILSLFSLLTFLLHVQALGIALKLTLQGQNQFWYPQTYYCIVVSLMLIERFCIRICSLLICINLHGLL